MVATLKDIAKRTGLSVPSVSLILNGQGHKFRTESCKAVFAAAQSLKYRPDMVMRRMGRASPRRDAIGLLVRQGLDCDSAEPATQPLICGIHDFLLERDQLTVMLNMEHVQAPLERNPPRLLAERFVDGMVILGQGLPLALEEMVQHYEIPAVWVRQGPGADHDTLLIDEVQAGRLATEHVIGLGHQQIAYLPTPQIALETGEALPTQARTPSALREQGYRAAMAGANLEPLALDAAQVSAGRFQDVVELILASQRTPQPVTAVVAGSSLVAIRLLSELNLTKLRCPRDLSLIAASDVLALHETWAPLTRVRCDRYAVGRDAAQMLMTKLEHDLEPQTSRTYRSELVEGQTTARPGGTTRRAPGKPANA
jgi:LacI family transcriptional regulator